MDSGLYQVLMESLKFAPEITILDGPPTLSKITNGAALIGIIKRILLLYNATKGIKMQYIQGINAHEQGIISNYKEHIISSVAAWDDVFKSLGCIRDDKRYSTMDKNYMESVWWAFAELYKKDIIYNSCCIQPYSPGCKTSLSNTEAIQHNRDITSTTYYVGFNSIDNPGLKFLVWTTAGWSLPMNILIAVNPNITYCSVGPYIVAESCVATLFGIYCQPTIIGPGSSLVGQRYKPLFEYLPGQMPDNTYNYTIVAADFVMAESTGLVHIAPCFDENDYNTAKSAGYSDDEILSLCKLNASCEYLPLGLVDVDLDFELTGKCVISQEVDNIIKSVLKYDCYKISTINGNYPHCKQTGVPLINRIGDTFLINVDKIKDKLLEKFEKTTWTPEGVKNGRFGKWIKNARNWNIGRTRDFGTPIPLWKCGDEYICISSVQELFELSGVLLDDLHKDNVSDIVIIRDGKKFKHVDLVFDCWFENACAPIGKIHYPFENSAGIDKCADIVIEDINQTRGWFYNLLIVSVALFDKLPYSHVLCTGIIHNDEHNPMEYIQKYGPDAYSVYLASSPAASGDDFKFNEDNLAQIATKLTRWTTIMNDYYPAEGSFGSDNLLDLWIVNALNELESNVETFMRNYKINNALNCALQFIDTLIDNYICLSRARLSGSEREQVLSTLKHVLDNFNIIMAPFAPFTAIKYNTTFLERFNRIECKKDYYIDIAIKIINIIRSKSKFSNHIAKLYIGHASVLPDNILEMIKDEIGCLIIESHEFATEGTYSIKFDYAKLGKKYGNKASFIKNYSYNQLILKQFYESGSILLQQGLTLMAEDAIIKCDKKMPFSTEGLVCEKSSCGDIIICADFVKNERVIQDSIALDIISETQKLLKTVNSYNDTKIYYSGEDLSIIRTRMPYFIERLKCKKIILNCPENYSYKSSCHNITIYLSV